MKSDADTIRSFLLGLLELFSRTVSSPSGKVDDPDGTPSQVDFSSEALTPISPSSEDIPNPLEDAALSTFSTDRKLEMPPISQLGELPAVQDHFQAVLKRRLQIAISENPPLFPWESTLKEYPVELSETSPHPWLIQLRSLQLPTVLPDDILAGLLSRCQELLAESLQPGVQLVKAVENLFPDQPQVMDQIAGLVLTNATVRSTATRDAEALKAAFPEGYEGANPQQQVTLTMLAARDILDTLMLELTPETPVVQRDWLTTAGKIVLSARYQPGTPNRIVLLAEIPQASQLSLPSLGEVVTQTRPGTLTLTLTDPKPYVVYPLEIHLNEEDSVPLTFAIRWLDTAD
jgi:hypothetical protein